MKDNLSMGILLKNAQIVNEGQLFPGHILIKGERIAKIFSQEDDISELEKENDTINIHNNYILPGVIDDQVHFREPGLTHKANIHTESIAAVAGGTTSFMEMPNTVPNTLTQQLLQDKYDIAEKNSLANYSFYMGVSNDNIDEVLKTDPKTVCGVKVFMGASTGNMLVDNQKTLEELFSKCKLLIAAHCEDETTIRNNSAIYREKYDEDVPISCHPLIRSEEACYKSSANAIALAKKYNTRFHLFHLSTAKEIGLLDNTIPLKEKRITAEVCIHHLWFSDEDYEKKGAFIKWNPAVKKASDRAALLQGLLVNKIDVIATDHAPHTIEEKLRPYFNAASGGPMVQHALVAMLELYHDGKISLEKIAEKMSHAVTDCFKIVDRGYLREGYFADLVVVDLDNPWTVEKENLLYKCGWSPMEGQIFKSKVMQTFVNGHLVYNRGIIDEDFRGKRMSFEV
ncbi:MAG: dihydroorotase [Flavobacteriales bacterium CG_4_9_14_3_um_filter_32_8]|nr:MAG: dihydroorotase [Flavobacteriales bacterium CG_4_9_14_3_um_filter_32_8]